MRSQLFLVPAALFASAPTLAATYMSVEQAQAAMFPGATFTPNFVKLDQDQFNAIIDDSDVNVWSRDIKAWRVSTGGWFILDQVRGRDDWITYAIGIGANGAVKHIEVLECLDKYDGITQPEWRAQFYGKQHGNKFDDIEIISGSTLSSSQMAAGVKRILSTYALVLNPPSG
jgi:hypothetical protein